MKYNRYKYKFYLNANHAIKIEDAMGQIHSHTWEIMIDIVEVLDKFIQFSVVEKVVDEILLPYQDKLINDVAPFDEINPTLENMAVYFSGELKKHLMENGWLLLRMEMSETPARSFIIDNISEEEAKENSTEE